MDKTDLLKLGASGLLFAAGTAAAFRNEFDELPIYPPAAPHFVQLPNASGLASTTTTTPPLLAGSYAMEGDFSSS